MQNVHITVLKLQKAQTPSNFFASLTRQDKMARHSRTPMPIKHLNELLELFSNFFSNKDQTIRDHLNKPLSEVDHDSPYAHDHQFSGCPFNSFTPISENSLRKVYFSVLLRLAN